LPASDTPLGSKVSRCASPVWYMRRPELVLSPILQWAAAVNPESQIKETTGLKGKKLGVRSPSDTGLFGVRGNLSAVGIDPDRDVEWISIGSGGPAGDALTKGKVDALASWDGELSRIESVGFKLRYLPNPPVAADLFGSTFGINQHQLKNETSTFIGIFRAIAKSTVFAAKNPRAAIRLHWELFPESKPKRLDENEALEGALFIVERRRPLWFPVRASDDQRLGAQSQTQWQSMAAFTGVTDRIADVSQLFTNDLIDDVNRFDRMAIEKQAVEW
jgi:NitT/TauT family transport system substrate-binding protein